MKPYAFQAREIGPSSVGLFCFLTGLVWLTGSIGRRKLPGHDGTQRAGRLLAEVVNRGLFKTRRATSDGH